LEVLALPVPAVPQKPEAQALQIALAASVERVAAAAQVVHPQVLVEAPLVSSHQEQILAGVAPELTNLPSSQEEQALVAEAHSLQLADSV